MGLKLRKLIKDNLGFRRAEGNEQSTCRYVAYHLAKRVETKLGEEGVAREDCLDQLEEYYEMVYKILSPICEAIENPNEEEDGEGWTEEGGEDEDN